MVRMVRRAELGHVVIHVAHRQLGLQAGPRRGQQLLAPATDAHHVESLALEDDLLLAGHLLELHGDRVLAFELAFEEFLGERVLDKVLDRPTQGPSTEIEVRTPLDQELLGLVGEHQRERAEQDRVEVEFSISGSGHEIVNEVPDAAFEFEETPDQQAAIDAVIEDMQSEGNTLIVNAVVTSPRLKLVRIKDLRGTGTFVIQEGKFKEYRMELRKGYRFHI